MADLRIDGVCTDLVANRTAMTARAVLRDETLVFRRPVARAEPECAETFDAQSRTSTAE